MFSKSANRILSVLMAVAVFFFILTGSIALPIYIRPFYYAHIEALDLPGISGFAADQIKEGYDAVLDYLTLPGREFSTGVMAYSESGKAHFEDCKFLFDLNAVVLIGSVIIVDLLLLLRKKTGTLELAGHSAAFWGAVSALVLPVVVGTLAALDFNRAFVVFHSLFFPGKSNWLFNWHTDQIIRVLPQVFFRNCAILIGLGVVFLSVSIIVADLVTHRKTK